MIDMYDKIHSFMVDDKDVLNTYFNNFEFSYSIVTPSPFKNFSR